MKSLVDERKKVLDGTAKSLRWSKWLWRLEFLSLLEVCKRQKGNHPLLEPYLPLFFFLSPYSFDILRCPCDLYSHSLTCCEWHSLTSFLLSEANDFVVMQSTTSQAKLSNYHHFVLEDRSNFIFVGSVDTCLNSKPSLLLNHNKFVFPSLSTFFFLKLSKLIITEHCSWSDTGGQPNTPVGVLWIIKFALVALSSIPLFYFLFYFFALDKTGLFICPISHLPGIFIFFLRLTGIMFHIIFRLVHQIIWGIYDEQSYFCGWKEGSLTRTIITGYHGCLNVYHLFLLKYDGRTSHVFLSKGKLLLEHKNNTINFAMEWADISLPVVHGRT